MFLSRLENFSIVLSSERVLIFSGLFNRAQYALHFSLVRSSQRVLIFSGPFNRA